MLLIPRRAHCGPLPSSVACSGADGPATGRSPCSSVPVRPTPCASLCWIRYT